jgi:hypothetical protein
MRAVVRASLLASPILFRTRALCSEVRSLDAIAKRRAMQLSTSARPRELLEFIKDHEIWLNVS